MLKIGVTRERAQGEKRVALTPECVKLLSEKGFAFLVESGAGTSAGFSDIIINHAHLGSLIEQTLGDGAQWGLHIQYSPEPPGALETAGGIATALPLLGDAPFLVVNGDVYCDFDFGRFFRLTVEGWQPAAHLVMVANPAHHAGGDFNLDGQRITLARGGETLTYAGIGVFSPAFFAGVQPGTVMKLRPLLDEFATAPRGIWAVYPHRRHLALRLRVLIDFLVARFAAQQPASSDAKDG